MARVLAFFAGVYRCSPAHLAGVVASVGLAPALTKRAGLVQRLQPPTHVGYRPAHAAAAPPHGRALDGFDLKQTREIMGVLRRCAAAGRTLVLAIHQLLDAERVCDRFVLLTDGRVRGAGTLETSARARISLLEAWRRSSLRSPETPMVRHAPLRPLLVKELWEVLSGRALWTMLLLLCPLIGYSFV